jgi:carboxymethylenebutenolidase
MDQMITRRKKLIVLLVLLTGTLAFSQLSAGGKTTSTTIAGMRAPILGIFGAQDKGIPAQSVRDFENVYRGSGREIDIAIYPDAGHAFMNPGNAAGYREKDAEDAWGRILGFFAKHFH